METDSVHLRSFGPGRLNYQVFACYDLLNGGQQTLSEYGVWTGDTYVCPYPKLLRAISSTSNMAGSALTLKVWGKPTSISP